MARQVREIEQGDKLMTTRDIYLDGKLIPAGTVFFVSSYDPYIHPTTGKVRTLVCSGYGANLALGIYVGKGTAKKWPSCETELIFLPLDCLQLAE